MQNSECRIQNERIEVACQGGSSLFVEFEKRGDRFGHVISFITADGECFRLLESVEGAADDGWPASPPLQSLSFERLPDGRRAALLVGMAGGSHWSASIEPQPDRGGLLFDIACRHGGSPAWRGSTYRMLAGESLQPDVAGDVCVHRRGDLLELVPPEPAAGRGTTRWRYTLAARELASR